MCGRIVLSLPATLACLALLSCASTGPGRYWSRFSPTEWNFQRYFDEREGDLDPIEGVWVPLTTGRGRFAVVRDSRYQDYEFVAVPIYTGGGRGEILAAFRYGESDIAFYEFACGDELRGEGCRTFPCVGTVTVAGRELWGDPKDCLCGFCATVWVRRYPFQQ